MNFSSQRSRIFVTCNRGLAPYVEREVSELGFSPTALPMGVELQGTLNDCIRLNLNLRCASQVLYSLRQFRCHDPDQLYEEVNRIAWEEILPANGYFSVNSSVYHPTINSTMFASVKVKDAIVDRLRGKTGGRPDCGSELRGAVVYLYWRDSQAEIYLDTSGETLAKHGYRLRPGKAPMMEALAAGTLLASNWDRRVPFINPMCGSGTVAIEAALLATRRSPGIYRDRFAFQYVVGYNADFFREQKSLVKAEVAQPESLKIVATDISPDAIENAKANAVSAGVANLIQFEVCDFRETPLPSDEPFVIFFNPEYGERLGKAEELAATYTAIGDFLKQKCGGSWGYVFTGNLDLAKKIGLRTKRRLEFHTANLECRLLEFELYAGSRKSKYATPNE
ncbi:MAG: hypothetical protein ABL888_17945 [Pirellulaceae bacterium]